MKKFFKLILTLSFIAVSSLQANTDTADTNDKQDEINAMRDRYNYELSIMIGKIRSECKLRQDYEKNLGLRLQFNAVDADLNIFDLVNLNIKPEVALSQSFSKSAYKKTTIAQAKTHTTRLELNALADIDVDFFLKPYILAGFGYEKFSHEYNKNDDSMYFDMGAGIKYPFKDYKYALKLEGKHFREITGNSDKGQRYGFFAGLDIAFGDNKCSDEDEDGVCDERDRCHGTPRGTVVDDKGCKIVEEVVAIVYKKSLDANFKLGSSKRFVDRDKVINDVSEFAKYLAYSNKYTLIGGHTSSEGKAIKNYLLSQRRANTIKKMLIDQGIDADKLRAVGYGEARPNYIPTKDKANRRIETVTFDTLEQMQNYIDETKLSKEDIVYEMDIR
jgi:OOP family OmpA-OmpF porin